MEDGVLKDGATGEAVSLYGIDDLLNTLHQENQQLKHYKLYEDNKRLQTIIADLKEENEQLRFLIDINSVSERKKLERQVDDQQTIIKSLKEENEELRKENKDLNDIEWEKFKKKYHLE